MANEKLTITLTGRAPVTVNKGQWPIIASAKWHDGGEFEHRANRHRSLVVRQHDDGRTIVYGVYSTNWQGELDARGGELLTVNGADADNIGDAAQVIAAIYRVADYLQFDRHFADRCIADLPAEEL